VSPVPRVWRPRFVGLVLCLGWLSPCGADETATAPAPAPVTASAPVTAPATGDARLALGPSLYTTSSYPGARSTRSEWLPFIDAEYANRFYMSASDLLGVYAYKSASTQTGAAVQYDLTERRSRDDERFRNLRNVGDTPRFKLFASHTESFVTGDFNVATDMAGRGQGTLAQANLWATAPFTPAFMVSVGPGVTWADTRYMHTFYSISAAQTAVSPFAPYEARAGAVDFHWNGLATYDVSSRWSLGVSEYAARLHGSAVDSPVTSRRAQSVFFAWAAYKLK
jgi:outer membrane protein